MTKQQQRTLLSENTTAGGPALNGATMIAKIQIADAGEFIVLMAWEHEFVTASWRDGYKSWGNGHYFDEGDFADAVADMQKRALHWLTMDAFTKEQIMAITTDKA